MSEKKPLGLTRGQATYVRELLRSDLAAPAEVSPEALLARLERLLEEWRPRQESSGPKSGPMLTPPIQLGGRGIRGYTAHLGIVDEWDHTQTPQEEK